jgi:Ni/Co efflux regulator RcnB
LIQRIGKSLAAVIMVAALSWFVATPLAQADDRSHCQHAVEKAEGNLDHAIHDHGERSRQADEKRRDLNAERERCWGAYHQWWNGHDHRWETEHNWEGR